MNVERQGLSSKTNHSKRQLKGIMGQTKSITIKDFKDWRYQSHFLILPLPRYYQASNKYNQHYQKQTLTHHPYLNNNRLMGIFSNFHRLMIQFLEFYLFIACLLIRNWNQYKELKDSNLSPNWRTNRQKWVVYSDWSKIPCSLRI